MAHPHNTRDWSAKEHGSHEFVVKGQVQTLNTGEHPKLVEAKPQGINPKILILDLEVPQAPGPVGNIVSWKDVTFHVKAADHAFKELEVRGDVDHPVTIPVH